MNITVSRRLLEKLSMARDALSHSHPGAPEETILEVGLDLVIERHRKRRGIGAKPRKKAPVAPATEPAAAAPPPPPPPPRSKRSRYVSAVVWRTVWERDRGCCAFPLENGGVCGETYQLELDHIKGFALGAATTAEDTRLACRKHQDIHARRLFGDKLMDKYTRRPRGPGCSEPVAAYAAAAPAQHDAGRPRPEGQLLRTARSGSRRPRRPASPPSARAPSPARCARAAPARA